MTIFIILAAVLVLLALVLLAPPLLRLRTPLALDRNQQNVVIAQERLSELETDLNNGVLNQSEFEQAKLELEQALLLDISGGDDTDKETPETPQQHGRLALGSLAVLVPALTVGLYLYLGEPQMIGFDPQQQASHAQNAGHGGEELPPVEEMIESLVSHLKEQPEDAEGWFLLGRTYMVMKDYPKAVTAFDTAYKLVGDIPSAMLSLADAMAMANNGDMTGRPAELIRKAVTVAPQDPTALWLAGMVERQSGNLEAALTHFEALKPLLAGEPESVAKVNGFITDIQRQLGQAEPVQSTSAEAVVTAIKVKVSLASELQAQVKPEQLVFVYAKALQGPPMPLAAAKLQVKDLPVEVTLDDSSAMMPQMKLSNFDQVIVGARVSMSGDPIAKSGDFNGEISPVMVQTNAAVDVVINSTVQ
ncbi:MAG: c-type cytochrome biogenesis protein CcmI [Chromatiales bacterium]|nr:c-type cytochrome biogenesis protein CcmI [Chromatiales bacterium]